MPNIGENTKKYVNNAMLQLSGVCNFRCRMCGHAKNNYGFMSERIFKRTISECKRNDIEALIFAGPWGEPTLHPNWKEFVDQAVKNEFSVILSTNASRLNKQEIDFLAISGLETLQVSFSGYDQNSYESVYVNGDFQAIKKILTDIKSEFEKVKSPPKVLINGVCDYKQPDEFVDNTYRFLYKFGYSDEEINIVRPNNFGGKKSVDNTVKRKEKLRFCSVLENVLGVYWDGKVTACACLDNDRKMLIGDILNESIADIRTGERFTKIVECFNQKNLENLEMCKKCDVPYGEERNIKIIPHWKR